MNQMRQAPVQHILWGDGRVVRRVDNTIAVRFPQQGEKVFLYPDVFDHFLVMCDPEQERAIAADLAEKHAAEEAAQLAAQQAREATAVQAAVEKALEAAEKRTKRATARKKGTGGAYR